MSLQEGQLRCNPSFLNTTVEHSSRTVSNTDSSGKSGKAMWYGTCVLRDHASSDTLTLSPGWIVHLHDGTVFCRQVGNKLLCMEPTIHCHCDKSCPQHGSSLITSLIMSTTNKNANHVTKPIGSGGSCFCYCCGTICTSKCYEMSAGMSCSAAWAAFGV
jgi:hypothetical protein